MSTLPQTWDEKYIYILISCDADSDYFSYLMLSQWTFALHGISLSGIAKKNPFICRASTTVHNFVY
jgi:hypothetical protein